VPALILLSGLPGTGKSFLASAIAARYPAAIVRSDEVRKVLFPAPTYSTQENGVVYLICYALLGQLLSDGFTVIFDATNLVRDGRKRARRIATRAGARTLTLLTDAPAEVVAQRLRARTQGSVAAYSSDADQAVHEKLATTVESMSVADAPYARVDTSGDIESALRLVDAFLAPHPLGRDAPAATHDDTAAEQIPAAEQVNR
jgi:predicted kinase